MAEKIEWYKEVLELEPNSKLFFPLARLLKAENRYDEAAEVLEHGLERHPEFLEARLFFIELLHKTGRRAACADQVNKISCLFSGYTEFWQTWAACLSAHNDSPDMSSALRFVAAHFMRNTISMQEVFDKGIDAILRQMADNQPVQAAFHAVDSVAAPVEQATPAIASAEEEALPLEAEDGRAESEESQPDILPEPDVAEHAVQTQDAVDASAKVAEDADEETETDGQDKSDAQEESDDQDEAEEHFSLRTRSMAEVLAEQGDIKGALDIYQELAAAATDSIEKADLTQRIATLNQKLITASDGSAPQATPETEPSVGKEKLISMLEALAERVEARAQG